MTLPARLSIVTLGVADLDRVDRVLRGARLAAQVGLDRGLDRLVRHGRFDDRSLPVGRARPRRQPPAERTGRFGGITLAINVESPEAVTAGLDAAVAAGGTLLKPATLADWGGTSGYFADPDGHPWEVAHNPGFPIDEDGRVRIP